MKCNIWNKWDPLRVCMLGNSYTPEFFNGVPDKAGDPLKRICEETLEDLEDFNQVLQDFGVKVLRPKLDSTEKFLDNPKSHPRPPSQPRDTQIVLGNTLYITGVDHPAIAECLYDYDSSLVDLRKVTKLLDKDYYNIIAGSDYPEYDEYLENYQNSKYFKKEVWQDLQENFSQRYTGFNSATCFVAGKDLYPDCNDSLPTEEHFPNIDQFRVNTLNMHNTHCDGNFHPIKPGAILSLHDVQDYAKTFPGWDVCYLPDQSWNKLSSFWKLKERNRGKWWVPGEEDNLAFTNFVETWLQEWVGYVEETVFDVNVLMLDEHHCCLSNLNNEQVNAFLKKHKVEPVYVPWRHRYFWDGGLHCITFELYREGIQKDYFPERTAPITDEGYEW